MKSSKVRNSNSPLIFSKSLLTNSVEQSPCLEADSRVAIEAIQQFQRNNLLMFLFLTQMKPHNTLSPHLFNIHININPSI